MMMMNIKADYFKIIVPVHYGTQRQSSLGANNCQTGHRKIVTFREQKKKMKKQTTAQ